MNLTLIVIFFVFGTIIGSFLNVVIYRYNTGKGLGGRSQCFSCKHTLHWYDLVPIFSYLSLGGRCRYCKAKISPQYMTVELLTGILFAGVYIVDAGRFGIASQYYGTDMIQFAFETVYDLIVVSILTIILVYDMRHKIIPDSFAYSFATLAILHLFISVNEKGITFLIPSANSMIAGVALAFPFYLLWLISDGRWMGLGDAKLALGIGWFLGLSAGLTAVIFGFWIGAAVSILLLLLSKVLRTSKKVSLLGLKVTLPRLSMKSEVPFAPFLIAGLLLVFFFGYNVTTFIL